ncbi:2-heptaprenyl-1,4-naphthoquinone methyltransferase, putative [Perkinsus marinus ATCC 50983]|uniref:2-heptaprenyl-1,4-naphthoquinone methyltransferase, putative n=1 Tax=Perkinsus marinus (strain ATCC 50983 / TXsc) TaxID=423536 RepID=C5LY03_PERM5|nr:2-heptaprenyl-1,4-naphthoquinone methyltransferase, putative [Perkinsus marinus ATCC 50983]EEQ98333.1 2-heptaprenyl-1,4-naphthoquinone methyltransferase, putative [Perkinsus marinus ATCC 50983]|eukprot:XP_002765616.1 2-heptaprenyl-1,4-naphthoquinone methyltransferase, putative [Perkinsus marinus ATCC 50983]
MPNCQEEASFDPDHYPEGPNKKFLEGSEQELLDEYLPKFEGDRQLKNHLDSVLHILDLKDNMVSVDVGAGTGLFTRELAKCAGAKVYATEISPGFLEYLKEDSRLDKNRVHLIKCTEESLCLPEEAKGTVDLVLVCDVYHHLTHPQAVLRDIKAALKGEGRLVLIDHWRDPKKASHPDEDWVFSHMRGDKEDFVWEVVAAGFRVVEEPEIQGVEENYAVVFEKTL